MTRRPTALRLSVPLLALCLLSPAACTQTRDSLSVAGPNATRIFFSGYRGAGDLCRRTSRSTISPDQMGRDVELVTCPTGHPHASSLIAAHGAQPVAEIPGRTVYAVPRPRF